MVQFLWNQFSIGEKVQVSTTNQKLEDIALDESYIGITGVVTRSNNKSTIVNFGNDTVALNNDMLIRVEHTYNDMPLKAQPFYNDMPNISEYSDEYVDEMWKMVNNNHDEY